MISETGKQDVWKELMSSRDRMDGNKDCSGELGKAVVGPIHQGSRK